MFKIKILILLSFSLFLSACVVSKDDFKEALKNRDKLAIQLNDLHINNGNLYTFLSTGYDEREVLLSKLSKLEKEFSVAREKKALEDIEFGSTNQRGGTRHAR